MRIDAKIAELWKETEGAARERAQELLRHLDTLPGADSVVVEKLRSLFDAKDYRGIAMLIGNSSPPSVAERQSFDGADQKVGGFSLRSPPESRTLGSTSQAHVRSLAVDVRATADAVLADYAHDSTVTELVLEALESPLFDPDSPQTATMSDKQRVYVLNSIRTSNDARRASPPPPSFSYGNAATAVAGLKAARSHLVEAALEPGGTPTTRSLYISLVLQCLTDNLRAIETLNQMTTHLATADLATLRRVWDAAQDYTSTFQIYGTRVFGPNALDHALGMVLTAEKALPVEPLRDTAYAYLAAGKFDRAAKTFALLHQMDNTWARNAELQCTVLHSIRHGNWLTASADLAILTKEAPAPGFGALYDILTSPVGERLRIPKRVLDSLDVRESVVLWAGLVVLGESSLSGLEYASPSQAIGHQTLVAVGRAKIPAELRSAIDALRAVRELLRNGPKPPTSQRKAEEQRAILRADVLMTDFRDSLLQGSRLPQAEAESFAAGIRIKPNARSRYDSGELRAGLTELFLLTSGAGLGAFETLESELKRAGADMITREIDLGHQPPKAFTGALFHEYGHHLEYMNPLLREAMQSWVRSRATSAQPVPLDHLVQGMGYQADEVAYPDSFVSPYVGREYQNGFTEVLAMGLERFRSGVSMTDFMADDEEHFALVLGVLEQ